VTGVTSRGDRSSYRCVDNDVIHCAHILFYNRVLGDVGSLDLGAFPSARRADLSHRHVAFRVGRQVPCGLPVAPGQRASDSTEPEFSAPVRYDRDDLLGGYPAARRYAGWQTFFDLGDGQVKNNKKIDTTISSVLFTLPVPAIAPHTQTAPTVTPQRNLLRQLTWGLPSGQAIPPR
jgi:hypothetical protein